MKEGVWVLQHVHLFDDGDEDVKLIGVYSTEAKGKEAIERLRIQPGFRDAQDGFTLDCYPWDRDHWAEGYETSVYSVKE